MACKRALRIMPLHLNDDESPCTACGQHFHFIADSKLAGDERPGYDGAESSDRECAINRQPRDGGSCLGFDSRAEINESRFQFIDSPARTRADGDDRSAVEK